MACSVGPVKNLSLFKLFVSTLHISWSLFHQIPGVFKACGRYELIKQLEGLPQGPVPYLVLMLLAPFPYLMKNGFCLGLCAVFL